MGKRQFGRAKRRSVGISFSDDFEHWTAPELVLAPDEIDDLNTARRNAYFRSRLTTDHTE